MPFHSSGYYLIREIYSKMIIYCPVKPENIVNILTYRHILVKKKQLQSYTKIPSATRRFCIFYTKFIKSLSFFVFAAATDARLLWSRAPLFMKNNPLFHILIHAHIVTKMVQSKKHNFLLLGFLNGEMTGGITGRSRFGLAWKMPEPKGGKSGGRR